MPCLDRIVRNNMGEKSKVRRCLFGSPDHESLRKDLDEQLKRTRSDMTSTWNFDADTDKPLVGRYEWTLMKQDEDLSVPSYYFKGYRPTKFRKAIRERSSDSVSSQVTPFVSRISLDDSQDDLQRENETTPELRPSQRQSRIDEFYVKTKRPACKRRLSTCSSSDSDSDDRPRKSPKVE